jgi:hypothetical protein
VSQIIIRFFTYYILTAEIGVIRMSFKFVVVIGIFEVMPNSVIPGISIILFIENDWIDVLLVMNQKSSIG